MNHVISYVFSIILLLFALYIVRLLDCNGSTIHLEKKDKKNISFVAPLCAMEAPFWDQSALCQELAKRRELLPQALSTYPEHAVPLGDEVMIHWSNGCSWENWCKYCVLPWKSLEVQDQAKHVFSLG